MNAASAQPTLAEDLEKIIVQGNAERLVGRAQEIGRRLAAGGLTTTQIRGIFGTVRQIDLRWNERGVDDAGREAIRRQAMRQLLLLQPRLAYQAKRQAQVKALEDVLVPAIQLVQGDRQKFRHFMDFFEAILAYHVAAGGKTS